MSSAYLCIYWPGGIVDRIKFSAKDDKTVRDKINAFVEQSGLNEKFCDIEWR
jgi:hypothetical protein